MLDKILGFVADVIGKPITYKANSVVNMTPTANAEWTATEDGMMVIAVAPLSAGTLSYCYITSNGTELGMCITDFGNTMTQCIPMKKGAIYKIIAIKNIKSVSLHLYPFDKLGGVL